MIIFVYFSFTSLTTVGFGDYHPRSDFERVYIAFSLLFGVAIFSYIMGEFIEMISNVDIFGNKSADGDDLARFFGVLKKFNNNEDIELNIKRDFESYFEHRNSYDKTEILKNDLFF